MTVNRGRGIIDTPSNHSVDETVEKLKGILQAKGVMLFALVDHSGEAEKVGMKMRPTKLLIFGNPKAGTPVMLAAPKLKLNYDSVSRSNGKRGRHGAGNHGHLARSGFRNAQ